MHHLSTVVSSSAARSKGLVVIEVMSPAPVSLLGRSNNAFASGIAESLMAITGLTTR